MTNSRQPPPPFTRPATLITGNTELIAHIGYPTQTFKSPMIYNPYFEPRNRS